MPIDENLPDAPELDDAPAGATLPKASELNPMALKPEQVLDLHPRHVDFLLEIVVFNNRPEDGPNETLAFRPDDDDDNAPRYDAGDVPEYSRRWHHMRILWRPLRQAGYRVLLMQHENGEWSAHVYRIVSKVGTDDVMVFEARAQDAPEAAATVVLQTMLPEWRKLQQQRRQQRGARR